MSTRTGSGHKLIHTNDPSLSKYSPSREELVGLAEEFYSLWHHPQTDIRLKKRILRAVIEEIITDVDSKAGVVQLLVHWKGGQHSELTVPRRKRGDTPRHLRPDVAHAICTLAKVLDDSSIAGCLTKAGQQTPSGKFWTKEAVAVARNHRQVQRHSLELQKAEGWMTLTQAAAFLGIASKTLRRIGVNREIPGSHPLHEGPWVFNRADLETDGAKRPVDRVKGRAGRGAGLNPDEPSLDLSTT